MDVAPIAAGEARIVVWTIAGPAPRGAGAKPIGKHSSGGGGVPLGGGKSGDGMFVPIAASAARIAVHIAGPGP